MSSTLEEEIKAILDREEYQSYDVGTLEWHVDHDKVAAPIADWHRNKMNAKLCEFAEEIRKACLEAEKKLPTSKGYAWTTTEEVRALLDAAVQRFTEGGENE